MIKKAPTILFIIIFLFGCSPSLTPHPHVSSEKVTDETDVEKVEKVEKVTDETDVEKVEKVTDEAKAGPWHVISFWAWKVSEYNSWNSREGYDLILVRMYIENIGSGIESIYEFGSSNGFDFHIIADGDFTYTGFVEPIGVDAGVFIPPSYRFTLEGIFEIPKNATNTKLVITPWQGSKKNISNPIMWNLDQGTTTAEPFLPSNDPNIRELGEAIEQKGVLVITPQAAGVEKICSNGYTWWTVYVQIEIKNNYGYDVIIDNLTFQLFDEQGGVRTMYVDDSSWMPLGNVAPGLTHIGTIYGDRYSHKDADSSFACDDQSEWGAKPTNLRMLVSIPAVTEPNKIDAVWAIFNLGELSELQ